MCHTSGLKCSQCIRSSQHLSHEATNSDWKVIFTVHGQSRSSKVFHLLLPEYRASLPVLASARANATSFLLSVLLPSTHHHRTHFHSFSPRPSFSQPPSRLRGGANGGPPVSRPPSPLASLPPISPARQMSPWSPSRCRLDRTWRRCAIQSPPLTLPFSSPLPFLLPLPLPSVRPLPLL